MARAMLEHRNAPRKYWAEAVSTAVYLLNRSPTLAVKHKTPEEAWFGHKPRINHLKVFGSLAYVGIPDTKRTKLDSKSQKLMLTGYSHTHKAYRLIDVNTDRLIFSRDVGFDEELGPFQRSASPPHSEIQSSAISDLGPSIFYESFDATDTPPQPPPDNTAPAPAPVIPTASDIGSSTLRPKWWTQTISDLRPDELIEGRTSKNKSIQHNTVNVALMANIHCIPEPQTYAEAKGILEWEQAMDVELHSLKRITLGFFQISLLGRNPLAVNGSIRSSTMQMVPWTNTKPDLLLEDSPNAKALTMRRPLPRRPR